MQVMRVDHLEKIAALFCPFPNMSFSIEAFFSESNARTLGILERSGKKDKNLQDF